MIPAYRQRNYFQSALYVIIVAVVAIVLLERLLTYAEAAEKAAMEATLSQLHSGLYARVALLALRGEQQAIEVLPTQNPFPIAHLQSPNFLGEFEGVPSGAKSGNWFYDRGRHELVYVPRLTRYLSSPNGGGSPPVLRYRVEILKTSKFGYTGVALKPVGVVRWEPLP